MPFLKPWPFNHLNPSTAFDLVIPQPILRLPNALDPSVSDGPSGWGAFPRNPQPMILAIPGPDIVTVIIKRGSLPEPRIEDEMSRRIPTFFRALQHHEPWPPISMHTETNRDPDIARRAVPSCNMDGDNELGKLSIGSSLDPPRHTATQFRHWAYPFPCQRNENRGSLPEDLSFWRKLSCRPSRLDFGDRANQTIYGVSQLGRCHVDGDYPGWRNA